jgi:hypothetical protein
MAAWQELPFSVRHDQSFGADTSHPARDEG